MSKYHEPHLYTHYPQLLSLKIPCTAPIRDKNRTGSPPTTWSCNSSFESIHFGSVNQGDSIGRSYLAISNSHADAEWTGSHCQDFRKEQKDGSTSSSASSTLVTHGELPTAPLPICRSQPIISNSFGVSIKKILN